MTRWFVSIITRVDAYNRFIPQAFDRANLAYQDNNAVLKELIDQYQFQGQDRLAASVAQQGAMAAAGRTGRGAMTSQVALIATWVEEMP